MKWNYRVVKKDGFLGIHGVYYDEDGNVINIDIDPNTYVTEDLDDLRNRLELMLESLDKEIIDFESIKKDPF